MYKYKEISTPVASSPLLWCRDKNKQMGGSRQLSLLHLCCCSRRLLERPPHNCQGAPPAHDSRNAPPSSSSSSSAFNKNFNSLYDSPAEPDALTGSHTTRTLTTGEEGEDDVITSSSGSEPDLSAVFASRRLTRPASTGRSNSILADLEEDEGRAVGFGAVPKMSPDPYEDFKKSIEEMVSALGLRRPAADEQQQQQVRRLQELLLCYLALNRKSAHKYIVGAFADVLRARGFSSPTTTGG